MHLEFQKHREVLAEYEVKMEDMSVEGMERERVHQANLTIVERVEKESKACLEQIEKFKGTLSFKLQDETNEIKLQLTQMRGYVTEAMGQVEMVTQQIKGYTAQAYEIHADLKKGESYKKELNQKIEEL